MTDQDQIQQLTTETAELREMWFRSERDNEKLSSHLAVVTDALKAHEEWHRGIGVMTFRRDDGKWDDIGINLSLEYEDSSLGEQTRQALATPSPAADALLQDRERLTKIIAILDSFIYTAQITLGQWTELREAIGYRQAKASTKEEA